MVAAEALPAAVACVIDQLCRMALSLLALPLARALLNVNGHLWGTGGSPGRGKGAQKPLKHRQKRTLLPFLQSAQRPAQLSRPWLHSGCDMCVTSARIPEILLMTCPKTSAAATDLCLPDLRPDNDVHSVVA